MSDYCSVGVEEKQRSSLVALGTSCRTNVGELVKPEIASAWDAEEIDISLPLEVIGLIMEFLISEDLLTVSLVCKDWLELSRESPKWKYICQEKWEHCNVKSYRSWWELFMDHNRRSRIGVLQWKCQEFLKEPMDTKIFSNPVIVSGIHWNLTLKKNSKSDKFVEMYLVPEAGEKPKESGTSNKATTLFLDSYLYNFNDVTESVSASGLSTITSGEFCGCADMATLDWLERGAFLEDGCLYAEAYIVIYNHPPEQVTIKEQVAMLQSALNSNDVLLHRAAISGMDFLLRGDPDNTKIVRQLLHEKNVTKVVLDLMKSSNDSILRYLCAAFLRSLASEYESSKHILENDGVNSLLHLLREEHNNGLDLVAVGALDNLACSSAEASKLYLQHGVVEALVGTWEKDNSTLLSEKLFKRVVMFLSSVAWHHETAAIKIIDLGGVEKLIPAMLCCTDPDLLLSIAITLKNITRSSGPHGMEVLSPHLPQLLEAWSSKDVMSKGTAALILSEMLHSVPEVQQVLTVKEDILWMIAQDSVLQPSQIADRVCNYEALRCIAEADWGCAKLMRDNIMSVIAQTIHDESVLIKYRILLVMREITFDDPEACKQVRETIGINTLMNIIKSCKSVRCIVTSINVLLNLLCNDEGSRQCLKDDSLLNLISDGTINNKTANLMPDMILCIYAMLADEEERKSLRTEGIYHLINRLKNDSIKELVETTRQLGLIMRHDEYCKAVASQKHVIKRLLEMLSSSNFVLCQASAYTLCGLVVNNSKVCDYIAEEGGIYLLHQWLDGGDDRVRYYSRKIMGSLEAHRPSTVGQYRKLKVRRLF